MAMDLLTETFSDFGMDRVFHSTAELHAPWGIAIPPLPGTVVFHVLTEGRAVVDVEGATTVLEAGDVLLVPHGTGHTIASDADADAANLFDLPRVEVTDRYERIRTEGGGPATTLFCGALFFSGMAVGRLMASLPPVLRPSGADEWFATALAAMRLEAHEGLLGNDVVTARLADVLIIRAVRDWLITERPARGWVAALRDPHVGRSLAAFHERPGDPWTLPSLAARAGLGRSAYAERFTALLGTPPMSYVTQWRMDLAARLVRDGEPSLARVAEKVGYQSEAAFNRAFRRAHQMTPGAWRRHRPHDLDLVLRSFERSETEHQPLRA